MSAPRPTLDATPIHNKWRNPNVQALFGTSCKHTIALCAVVHACVCMCAYVCMRACVHVCMHIIDNNLDYIGNTMVSQLVQLRCNSKGWAWALTPRAVWNGGPCHCPLLVPLTDDGAVPFPAVPFSAPTAQSETGPESWKVFPTTHVKR